MYKEPETSPMNTTTIKNTFETQLKEMMSRLAGCFAGKRGVRHADGYIRGLLSPAERKNGWQLAEV